MKKRTSARERDNEGHIGRDEEFREYEDRDHEIDYEMEMKYTSPVYIDESKIPAGFKYTWIRHALLGEPDDANWATFMRRGWKPVPASRHPEKKQIDTFKRLDHMKDFLHHGDVICCERSLRECEREAEHFRKINEATVNGIAGMLSLNTPSSMPNRGISETSRGYGADPGGYKTF